MSKSETHKELAHYSPWMRLAEIVSIILFAILWGNLIYVAWNFESSYRWIFFLSILVGMIAADAVSGLVHWAADTWGSVQWPILGPTLIRSFREHHVDQKAITHHDFIEANGATALIIIPWLVLCTFWVPKSNFLFFVWNSFLWLCVWSLMTNQFHKWSHLEHPPFGVTFLQKAHIIISVEHHKQHHVGSHEHYYCITTGWLNPIAEKFSLFRLLESIITKLTGAKPREEDLKLAQQLKSVSTI